MFTGKLSGILLWELISSFNSLVISLSWHWNRANSEFQPKWKYM
jgi:hypothetical protein